MMVTIVSSMWLSTITHCVCSRIPEPVSSERNAATTSHSNCGDFSCHSLVTSSISESWYSWMTVPTSICLYRTHKLTSAAVLPQMEKLNKQDGKVRSGFEWLKARTSGLPLWTWQFMLLTEAVGSPETSILVCGTIRSHICKTQHLYTILCWYHWTNFSVFLPNIPNSST